MLLLDEKSSVTCRVGFQQLQENIAVRFVSYYASRDKVCQPFIFVSLQELFASSVYVQLAMACHQLVSRQHRCVISLCADSYKSAVCVRMAVTSSVCVRKLPCVITLCADSYNRSVCAQIAVTRHQFVCK